MSSTNAVEKACRSSLDVILMYTLYGGTQIPIQGENIYWNIWQVQKINILNKVKESTFVINNRKEAIAIILVTDMIGNFPSNWHVSDVTSLLDHRYTLFQVDDLEIIKVTYPKP